MTSTETSTRVDGSVPVKSTHPNPVVRWWDNLAKPVKILGTLAFVVLLIFLPIIEPPGLAGGPTSFSLVLAECARYALIALGLNIVVGLAGLLDLGYIGFFAIGAYVVALLTAPGSDLSDFWSTGWLMAVPFAIVITAISGLILGIPTLRVRGDYLAIVTLGFGELVRLGADNIPLLRGQTGFKEIAFPKPFTTESWPQGPFFAGNNETLNYGVWWYWALLLAIVLVLWATRNLERSRVGRAWISLREDEDAAEIMGVSTFKYKVWAFALGAGVGGLAGAFMAGQVQFVNNQKFDVITSVLFLVAVVLGGQGNKFGVIIGACIVAYVPARFAGLSEYKYLIFGTVLILLMLFRPQGILPARHRLMGAGPDAPPVTDPVITGHVEPDAEDLGETSHVEPGSSPLHKTEGGDGRGRRDRESPGDLDGKAGDDLPVPVDRPDGPPSGATPSGGATPTGGATPSGDGATPQRPPVQGDTPGDTTNPEGGAR